MSLNVYLHFNSNCREAFEFYRSIFGGEFDLITTFGEGPPEMQIPEEERDGIMHVSYRIGDNVLMGSDVPSTFGMTVNQGSNFSLSMPPAAGRRPTSSSPSFPRAVRFPCRWATCSGAPTSAPAPTSSASTGCSTSIRADFPHRWKAAS